MNESTIRDTNKCYGLGTDRHRDSFDPMPDDDATDPGGNPIDPLIIKSPDQVAQTGAAAELANCTASAFGFNATIAGAEDTCSQLILCGGHTGATISGAGKCSCGGAEPSIPPDMAFAAQCQTVIQCLPGETCSCDPTFASGPVGVVTSGGMPEPTDVTWMQAGEAWSADPASLQDPLVP